MRQEFSAFIAYAFYTALKRTMQDTCSLLFSHAVHFIDFNWKQKFSDVEFYVLTSLGRSAAGCNVNITVTWIGDTDAVPDFKSMLDRGAFCIPFMDDRNVSMSTIS